MGNRIGRAELGSLADVSRRRRRRSSDRVLDAAKRCCERWGIAKVTIDDIATEAGVSRATLYRMFPGGKDVLFEALRVRELEDFFAGLQRAPRGRRLASRTCSCAASSHATRELRGRSSTSPLMLASRAGRGRSASSPSTACRGSSASPPRSSPRWSTATCRAPRRRGSSSCWPASSSATSSPRRDHVDLGDADVGPSASSPHLRPRPPSSHHLTRS